MQRFVSVFSCLKNIPYKLTSEKDCKDAYDYYHTRNASFLHPCSHHYGTKRRTFLVFSIINPLEKIFFKMAFWNNVNSLNKICASCRDSLWASKASLTLETLRELSKNWIIYIRFDWQPLFPIKNFSDYFSVSHILPSTLHVSSIWFGNARVKDRLFI